MTSKSFPVGKRRAEATKWYTTEISKVREDVDTALETVEDFLLGSNRGSVDYATAAALSACTAAGTKTGKTLTADANGALTVDGVAVADADVILVKNQVDTKDNGIYTVTDKGDGSSPFILTRHTSYDANADFPQMQTFFVQGGAANAGKTYYVDPNYIDLDVVALTFTEIQKVGIGETKFFNFDLAIGAAAAHTFPLPTGTWRIYDAFVQNLTAGETSDTAQIKKGANNVSAALDISGAKGAIVRAASLDPDYTDFVGGTDALGLTTVDNDAGDDVCALRLCVLARRIA